MSSGEAIAGTAIAALVHVVHWLPDAGDEGDHVYFLSQVLKHVVPLWELPADRRATRTHALHTRSRRRAELDARSEGCCQTEGRGRE
ncbi:hypothetical protein GCM10009629_41940 [Pseudonocardia alni]